MIKDLKFLAIAIITLVISLTLNDVIPTDVMEFLKVVLLTGMVIQAYVDIHNLMGKKIGGGEFEMQTEKHTFLDGLNDLGKTFLKAKSWRHYIGVICIVYLLMAIFHEKTGNNLFYMNSIYPLLSLTFLLGWLNHLMEWGQKVLLGAVWQWSDVFWGAIAVPTTYHLLQWIGVSTSGIVIVSTSLAVLLVVFISPFFNKKK